MRSLMAVAICLMSSVALIAPARGEAPPRHALVLRSAGQPGGTAAWTMQKRDRLAVGGDRISRADFYDGAWSPRFRGSGGR